MIHIYVKICSPKNTKIEKTKFKNKKRKMENDDKNTVKKVKHKRRYMLSSDSNDEEIYIQLKSKKKKYTEEHVKAIIKIQSLVRGFLCRKKISSDKNMLSDEIIDIINKNNYIKEYEKNIDKDENSLKNLLTEDFCLNQSQSIKLGIAMEKVIFDIINSNKEFKNLKEKNKKGEKEKDLLFQKDNTIYYAELKSNLNLDTEKSSKTVDKILEIKKELDEKYPDCTINVSLVGLAFFEKSEIKRTIANKYGMIKDNVVGIHDFFNKLGMKIFDNKKHHIEFVNRVASALFRIDFDVSKIY